MEKLELDRGKFYYGLFVDKEEETRLNSYLEEQSIEIKNLRPKEMHITLAFVANNEAMDYIDGLIENGKLKMGDEIKIHIEAYGEYRDNEGRLLNQGLKVRLENPELERYCNHGIAHLTLSTNPEKRNGRPLSKPVDTYKCNFDRELDFDITGKAGSFGKKGIIYENVPNMYKIGDVFIPRDVIDHPENTFLGSYLADHPELLSLTQDVFKDHLVSCTKGLHEISFSFPVGKETYVETKKNDIIRAVQSNGDVEYLTLNKGKETSLLTINIQNDDPLGRPVITEVFPGTKVDEHYAKTLTVCSNFKPEIDLGKTIEFLVRTSDRTQAEERFLDDLVKMHQTIAEVEDDYHKIFGSCEELEEFLFHSLVEEPEEFRNLVKTIPNVYSLHRTLEDYKDLVEDWTK